MAKVYITDRITNPDIEALVLKDAVSTEFHPDAEVLLVWHQVVDGAYMDRFPRLRSIIRYGVGYDRIDLEAARARGITVSNNPSYCVDEVSDTAMAMILNISRGVTRLDHLSRGFCGTWQENSIQSLRRAGAHRLAIIGAGRIGASVLQKARAFKFDLCFFDPYLPSGWERTLGATRYERLDDLLRDADIVSLHVPLNPETEAMVDDRFVASMKAGASLINTSRGRILKDLDVVLNGLRSNQLSNVALDVLPEEPPRGHPLIEAWQERASWLDGRLVINPHNAFFSQDASLEMRALVARNAARVLADLEPLDVVNSVKLRK
jgi:lactate dehydrogenase-like 2-hydroxyacid dehydrogenase